MESTRQGSAASIRRSASPRDTPLILSPRFNTANRTSITMRPKTKASAAQTNMAVSATSSKAKMPVAPPPSVRSTPTAPGPVRWSDVVAGRKSTHPAVAPVQSVINITELCENVLIYLSVQDLCRAKRVCRQLNTVINQSSVLKSNLFLEPRVNNTTWVIPSSELSSCDEGSILAGPKADRYVSEAKSSGMATRELDVLELHPALTVNRYHNSLVMFGGMTYFLRHYLSDPEWYFNFCGVEVNNDRIDIANLSVTSSLNNMYLSQPPIKKVFICRNSRYVDSNGKIWWGDSVNIQNPVGITFGQLAAAARAFKHHDSIVFSGGVPFTREEKTTIERAGEVVGDKDPFFPRVNYAPKCRKCENRLAERALRSNLSSAESSELNKD